MKFQHFFEVGLSRKRAFFIHRIAAQLFNALLILCFCCPCISKEVADIVTVLKTSGESNNICDIGTAVA